MENTSLPLSMDTPAEWLENLFDRASIFLAMQCRENLKIVAEQLLHGYQWLSEKGDLIVFDYLALLRVVNKAIWLILKEQ